MAGDRIVQLAVSDARRRAGDGWGLLGPELRRALVCEALCTKLAGMETEGLDARRLLEKFQARMDHVIQAEDFT